MRSGPLSTDRDRIRAYLGAPLIEMVGDEDGSRHRRAREVLRTLVAEGGDPGRRSSSARAWARSRTRRELEAIVERAIEADPEAAERVRAGNAKAIGPLVGFVMRETKGRADGGEVTRLIHEKLSGD